jgi:2-polyprenyl-3-methyl-5-hydroxy-6-metoxy-1,4-benzoquinol methylase
MGHEDMTKAQAANLTNLSQKAEGYHAGVRAEMLKYIPPDVATTLEFGCGSGGFSALIKRTLQAETWAVEIDKKAAAEAAGKLDKVIAKDATEAVADLPDAYFDCIVFMDVLEHLVDPYALLLSVRSKLTPRGVMVCSLPNVRYYENYIEFAWKGNWDYTEVGILDKTHLRFFTYRSIQKTFDQFAFEILTLEGIHPTRNKKFRVLNRLLFNAIDDLRYLQFAVVVRPKGQ